MRPRFSIALLTEDRSEQTWLGLRAVVERLLRRFDDDGTRRIAIGPADAKVRPILIANRWRSTLRKDEPEKRELWKYLAWTISEPGGFVVFHYDGDTRWSKRRESQGHKQFDEVRTCVAHQLAGARLPTGERISPAEITRRLSRLIECVPFYSVEAWLYQATTRAIELCKEQHRGADVETFQIWAANRTLLDDVPKPKDATCLRDKHNDELGKHVRVWDVVEAGQSLTCFVWALHGCGELADALAFPASRERLGSGPGV